MGIDRSLTGAVDFSSLHIMMSRNAGVFPIGNFDPKKNEPKGR